MTGANGAYTLYESEMRNNRTPGLNGAARRTENIAAREFTIYNALTSVSKIMNEIGEKTEAAVTELRTSTSTEAVEEYRNTADAFYSLIEEDLRICDEYSSRYIPKDLPEVQENAEEAEALPAAEETDVPEAADPESPESSDIPETPEAEENTEETASSSDETEAAPEESADR